MISANIDEGPAGDDYFELMLRNVWHISGGEGWCANTTCKRVLVVGEDDSQVGTLGLGLGPSVRCMFPKALCNRG